MSLGTKIRELRKLKGMTLEQLAEKADSSKSYIWEIENNKTPRPSADKILKLAAALNVIPEYLIDDEKTNISDAKDTAFFRKYNSMSKDAQEQIRKFAEFLDRHDG